MRIALVDDEPLQLERLSTMISAHLNGIGDAGHTIDTFRSGEEFLDSWCPGQYELIVLDIYMGGLLGIQVAHKIRETDQDVRLVFCTTSNEFASESYEVNANYYLKKPFAEAGIRTMFSRLDMERVERTRVTTLADGQKIMLRNILYTDYFNHIITIHCKHGDPVKTRIKQSEMEELLCRHPYFFCCSKGLIINFYEVVRMLEGGYEMSNGEIIPISRRKAKEVQDAYAKFRIEKMRKEAQYV